jgi:hypothetical protein
VRFSQEFDKQPMFPLGRARLVKTIADVETDSKLTLLRRLCLQESSVFAHRKVALPLDRGQAQNVGRGLEQIATFLKQN